jgi:hypothetical protein
MESVTQRHQTRSMEGAQLDYGIGDTLVSAYAVGFASGSGKEVAPSVRWSLNESLTVELASIITETLKISNDRYAMTLARKAEPRFMYLFFTLRSEFATYRTRVGNATLGDLECYLGLIEEKTSQKAAKIIALARARHTRYNALLTHVFKIASKSKRNVFMTGGSAAQMEREMLRAIVSFEYQGNKHDPTWTFREKGLVRVNDDFFLLQEYFAAAFGDQFKQLCERWGRFVLTTADVEELNQLPEAERPEKRLEKLRPTFQPAWSFLVALCHALQEGENEISGTDAFWLGLIDEVLGQTNLPLMRYLAEFQADPPIDGLLPDTIVSDATDPPKEGESAGRPERRLPPPAEPQT